MVNSIQEENVQHLENFAVFVRDQIIYLKYLKQKRLQKIAVQSRKINMNIFIDEDSEQIENSRLNWILVLMWIFYL